MRVLITGASGFIGSHAVAALQAARPWWRRVTCHRPWPAVWRDLHKARKMSLCE